jgi:hypothetical protein
LELSGEVFCLRAVLCSKDCADLTANKLLMFGQQGVGGLIASLKCISITTHLKSIDFLLGAKDFSS